MDQRSGEYVSFELASTDVTTATVVKVYDAEGTEITPALFISRNVRLNIVDVTIVNGASAAVLIEFFNDRDSDGIVDAGERICGGKFAANGGVSHEYGQPRLCKKALIPKVKQASAGDVYVTGSGFLTLT
jgi:hypothetical protein